MSFKDLVSTSENEGKEKHVPVIDAPLSVGKDEWFEISVVVGKEVAHPNTHEHHIEGIQVFFKEDGDKPVYKVADFTSFAVHCEPCIKLKIRAEKSGILNAISSCNIHGIWESEKKVEVK